MKKSVNIDDYVLANTLVLPECMDADAIKADLFAIMDELDKHYTMIRETSII